MINTTQLVYCSRESLMDRDWDDIARFEAIKSIKNKWLRIGTIILEVLRKACNSFLRW